VVVAALSGEERDSAQFQDAQNRRVGQFVLQSDAEDVKAGQRVASLKRAKGNALAPEQVHGVLLGVEDALAEGVIAQVRDVLEDLQADVAHTDLI